MTSTIGRLTRLALDVVVGFLPGPRQESYIYVSKPSFLRALWRCIRQVVMLTQRRNYNTALPL